MRPPRVSPPKSAKSKEKILGSSYLRLLLEFVPSLKSAKLHEEEATLPENEQNQNLLELTMTKFSTVLQELGETLPSTRSDSGTSPAITHLPSHRDAEILDTESSAPTPSFRLEIKGDKGQTLLMIPVSLKNLYSGMVVLEVNSLGFIRDPETLQGKQAILPRDERGEPGMDEYQWHNDLDI